MVVVNFVLALLLVAGTWIVISSALEASLRKDTSSRKDARRDRAQRRPVITGRSGGTFPRCTSPVNASPSPAIDVGLASRAGEQRA